MSRYRKGSHTVYRLHYHFVFVPKYRKPFLRGEIGLRVRELIREICRSNDIEIIQGHVRPDQVHLLLSVPPSMSPSRRIDAIVEAGKLRLRALIMTTVCVLIGFVPLALNLEAGGEMLQPMAAAAIGGLLVEIPVALFLIPCLYVAVGGKKDKLQKKELMNA